MINEWNEKSSYFCQGIFYFNFVGSFRGFVLEATDKILSMLRSNYRAMPMPYIRSLRIRVTTSSECFISKSAVLIALKYFYLFHHALFPLFARMGSPWELRARNYFSFVWNFDRCPTVALPDPCLLYTSPSPRDRTRSRMPSSA